MSSSGPPNIRRHGPAQAGPDEGYRSDQKDGTPPFQGKAEGVGVVQPGEEKASGRPYSSLPVLKGATGKMGRDSLSGGVGIG